MMSTAFLVNKPALREQRNLVLSEATMNQLARPNPTQKDVDVVIVGSGLSGSTAAFYMNRKGINVMVAEAQAEAGGNFRTKYSELSLHVQTNNNLCNCQYYFVYVVDGYQWEEGPNSFQPSPTILRFAKELGIIQDLVLADGKLPRFVYWDSKLHALPSGPCDITTFDLLSCTKICVMIQKLYL